MVLKKFPEKPDLPDSWTAVWKLPGRKYLKAIPSVGDMTEVEGRALMFGSSIEDQLRKAVAEINILLNGYAGMRIGVGISP